MLDHSDSNVIHSPPPEPITAESDHPSAQPAKPSPPGEFDYKPPQRTPDDENDIETVVTSSFYYDDPEGDDEINFVPNELLKKEVINLNQKKENNDDNTKIFKIKKVIKKIKNLFLNLWCQFFESPSKTELPPRESTPSPIVSALGESPPSPIELSSKPFPSTLTKLPPKASPNNPKLSTSRASTDNKKIEMFNYLVNVADINFDKIKIDDKNKINCFEIFFDEINDKRVEKFKQIYKKEGMINFALNGIVAGQKINEKEGFNNDAIKIELFNLINEKLKFDEKDLKDDKKIDIVNFFIKGIILNKNKIQNKLMEKIKE
jgi:hypothetical protein